MKTEFDFGYTLEIYEKGNYGTVKRKYFVDMIDLVTFTNKNARKYNTNYIINVIKKPDFITLYSGCIHTFNRRIEMALIQVTFSRLIHYHD